MNDLIKLNGKVAIVTGGGSGIGKAISLALAEAGARVVFSYNKSETSAREIVEQTSSLNVPAIMCKADMENTDDIEKLAHTAIKHYGTVDILVNNAGIFVDHDKVSTTDLDLVRQFLDQYEVSFIVLGQLERAKYVGDGLAKFDEQNGRLWREIYRERDTVIFEVIRE